MKRFEVSNKRPSSSSNVAESLLSHTENLKTADPLELDQERATMEGGSNTSPLSPKQLTTKRLAEEFSHVERAMTIFTKDDDADMECSSKCSYIMEDAIRSYKDLYEEVKGKLSRCLDAFFKPQSSASNEMTDPSNKVNSSE